MPKGQERSEKLSLAKSIHAICFTHAEVQGRIFRFICEHPQGVKSVAIEDKFGISPVGVRKHIADIRKKLAGHADSAAGRFQNWRCDLPKGKYRLVFTRITQPTRLFWQAHLDAECEVTVICNELMFYQDFARNTILRFMDVNPDDMLSKEQKLEALRQRHSAALREHPKLEPIYLYLISGEVAAADALGEWFEKNGGKRARRKISRLVADSEVFSASPILLGTIRTNRYIRKLLESRREGSKFCYGFSPVFGEMRLKRLEEFPEEQAHLTERDAQMSWSDGGATIKSRIESEGYAFGAVWRMHLDGRAVTIIGSDSTLAMQQIAAALVNETQMKRCLSQMEWPIERTFPPAFELLFAVQIEPGQIDYHAGQAELIGWRLRAPL